ncbi:hypothetical protein GUITHDRAFT_154037 [Guillardia theta CCMP2712]|uniref:Uncharacterized protein n=1 Tax=Guillardia theta (strain CCMP2712) TaxID=905079 RepID=L1IXA5_GUITC|nr:hypothetical protein GUITHDRAFT_154037 [Guillardia theta CCMP2712]EKX40893.1 hypothetical protein GUITHDRAFT_154037 [Guillardia theta CCMP2712]|eukprot:XP_005827873.1 hypothetical protein GUITHDRAFT_154037 [Guillardia theta CCMP2712]
MAEVDSPVARVTLMRTWGSETHLDDLILQAEEKISSSPDIDKKIEEAPRIMRRSSSLNSLSDAGNLGKARMYYNRSIGKEIQGTDLLPKLRRNPGK